MRNSSKNYGDHLQDLNRTSQPPYSGSAPQLPALVPPFDTSTHIAGPGSNNSTGSNTGRRSSLQLQPTHAPPLSTSPQQAPSSQQRTSNLMKTYGLASKLLSKPKQTAAIRQAQAQTQAAAQPAGGRLQNATSPSDGIGEVLANRLGPAPCLINMNRQNSGVSDVSAEYDSDSGSFAQAPSQNQGPQVLLFVGLPIVRSKTSLQVGATNERGALHSASFGVKS